MRKPYDKIELVKDRHKGERCFIVSTGPSLTLDGINFIQNEKTISMNTIYRLYPNTKWRPTYYTLDDIWFADKLVKENQLNFDDFATEYCFFTAE